MISVASILRGEPANFPDHNSDKQGRRMISVASIFRGEPADFHFDSDDKSKKQVIRDDEKYKYKRTNETNDLILDTKNAQKEYLELMKELLIRDPALARDIFLEELNELGFTLNENEKGLVLQKK